MATTGTNGEQTGSEHIERDERRGGGGRPHGRADSVARDGPRGGPRWSSSRSASATRSRFAKPAAPDRGCVGHRDPADRTSCRVSAGASAARGHRGCGSRRPAAAGRGGRRRYALGLALGRVLRSAASREPRTATPPHSERTAGGASSRAAYAGSRAGTYGSATTGGAGVGVMSGATTGNPSTGAESLERPRSGSGASVGDTGLETGTRSQTGA